jgi:acyl carrier protein
MEVDVATDQETIERELIAAIQVCMETGGKECPQLTNESVPLKDIKGFDSLCGIEVTVDLESKLGRDCGDDLFIAGSGKSAKPRSVREVAKLVISRIKRMGKGAREKHA